ncbi:MAG: rhomboid family intramembrane serine protease [Hyphomicrobium sp.]
MDLQFFITLNLMAISGLVMLIALVNQAKGGGGWIAVNAAVVAIGLLALTFAEEWSGLIVAGAFVPLVLAPGLLSHFARKRAMVGRMAEAARYSQWASLLHPTAASRFAAAVARALAVEPVDERVRALEALSDGATPEQRTALRALRAVERGDWQSIADEARRMPNVSASLGPMQIRALGESGDIEQMIRLYDSVKPGLGTADLNLCQLFVLAFTGHVEVVDLMLDNQASHLDPDTKTYWRAIARQRSPTRSAEGVAKLAELARTAKNSKTRLAAARHLQQDLPAVSRPLSPEAAGSLDEIETRAAGTASFSGRGWAQLPATVAIGLLNLLAFALEVINGGSEDLDVLVGLGAMWPPLVWMNGEWWRLLTASFLHFGPLHLGANMFMLLVLGRIVETAFGWQRYLIIYLLGGVLSTAAVFALMQWGSVAPAVLIGASGAIFAVFGAEAARQVAVWRRSRDALDRRQLVNLVLIMLVQVVIDFSVPEISATAHLSGFATGFLLGLALEAGSRRSSKA